MLPIFRVRSQSEASGFDVAAIEQRDGVAEFRRPGRMDLSDISPASGY
jgi:hypothetical protein